MDAADYGAHRMHDECHRRVRTRLICWLALWPPRWWCDCSVARRVYFGSRLLPPATDAAFFLSCPTCLPAWLPACLRRMRARMRKLVYVRAPGAPDQNNVKVKIPNWYGRKDHLQVYVRGP